MNTLYPSETWIYCIQVGHEYSVSKWNMNTLYPSETWIHCIQVQHEYIVSKWDMNPLYPSRTWIHCIQVQHEYTVSKWNMNPLYPSSVLNELYSYDVWCWGKQKLFSTNHRCRQDRYNREHVLNSKQSFFNQSTNQPPKQSNNQNQSTNQFINPLRKEF